MPQRLLDTLIPKHYVIDITLDDDLKNLTSRSTSTLMAAQETDELRLHAKDTDIAAVEVAVDSEVVTVTAYSLDRSADLLIIKLGSPVAKASEIMITTQARIEITSTMHGVYPAHYEENGHRKTIISTQLESHHAREVFPCIDEPSAKAEFELTLHGPKIYTYLSNMPVHEESIEGTAKSVTFEKSPIMSTYLLAFAVGEFGKLSAQTKRGVDVSAYAPESHVENLEFALKVATDCLDFFEDYFGITYPLPKADMVAIPEFAAAAMENWGLVTYRETALVYHPEQSSLSNKQMIAEVICHELAHQWFGNLVTMKWWDDLWLNEGFATWASMLASDALHPEWQMWTTFLSDDYTYALSEDALASSHPIRQPVESPKDINEIFDAISYRKGASVIRMLHDHMGADSFQNGLRTYLKRFSYGNASTEDLWEALSEYADFSVSEFMQPWTKVTGYPVLSVAETKDGLQLNQQHFLLDPAATPTDTIWPVPLLPNSQQLDATIFEETTTRLTTDTDTVIKFNDNHSGFYRTSYQGDLLQKLAGELAGYGSENRLGLLDDSFELAVAGHQETVAALELLRHYAGTKESQVWDVLGSSIGSVRTTLLGEEHEHLLGPLVEPLIETFYHELGWQPTKGESDNDALIRPVVLGLALRFKLFDAVDTANKLYESDSIHPDLRTLVYITVARDGDHSDYEAMWQNYLNEPLQEQKNRWARALTQFKQDELAKQTLERIQGDHIRKQDAISWLAGMFRNPHTRQTTWDWYRNNWNWIEENFAHGHIFTYFIVILSFFQDRQRIKEIREFFADKETEGIARSIEQTIEKINYQAAWHERDAGAVKDYLSTLR